MFFRQLDLIHLHDKGSSQADQHHPDGEQDDHPEGEHLLHDHADERADGCSQAHAQSIIIDAFSPPFRRDHGGYDGAGGGGSNAVAHPAQEPDDVHGGQRIDEEIHAGGCQVKQDPGIEHLLPAVQLYRTAGKQPGHQGPQHEDPSGQAGLTDGGMEGMDGFRSDDHHQHIINDVNQEIDQGIQDESSGPETGFCSHGQSATFL